jgi:hypothetical protein
MTQQDPQAIIASYLMDSSKHTDGTAQSGSISILKEQKMEMSNFYIVTYITIQQQQAYACIILRQNEGGSWEFASFLMMGGMPAINLPQKSSPQIAWCRSSDTQGSLLGVAVLPNETQSFAVRLKDSHGFVSISELENNAALFVTDQALYKPIYVEVMDHQNRVLSQKELS